MDMKQIGQRIRNAREAANITQEGLGTSADYLLQDFLEQPSELLAGEMASVLGQLPQDMQIRVLKGLRAFAGRG